MATEYLSGDEYESPSLSGVMFSRRNGVELDVVYCLSNEAMTGWFKIGFTTRTGAARANDLYSGYGDDYTTGVPVPFQVVKEWKVPSGRGEHVEKAVHRHLGHRRPNPKREFFRFDDAAHAVAEIERALQELDWYATAVADAKQKQREAELRSERRKAAADAERIAQERAREIALRVDREMRLSAEAATSDDCDRHGLAWATGVAVVLGGFGVAFSARDGFFVLVALAAVVAYFWNRSTPLKQCLASSEYQGRLIKLTTEAMQAEAGDRSALETVLPAAPPVEGDTISRRPRNPTDEWTVDQKTHPSVDRTPVLARCPTCSCLHRVGAAAGSYVRVHCERCTTVFDATTKASDEKPDVVAKRAYLLAAKANSPRSTGRDANDRSFISEGLVTARYVQPPAPVRRTAPTQAPQTEPRHGSATIEPAAPDRPAESALATGAATKFDDTAPHNAIVECSNCGRLHTINARPGDLVHVACEGCGQYFHETAAALTLGGAPMP